MSAPEPEATVPIPPEAWLPMGWLDLGEYRPPSGRPFRVRAPVMFTILYEDREDPGRPVPNPDRGWMLETLMPALAARLKTQMVALAEYFELHWPPEGTSAAAATGEPPP